MVIGSDNNDGIKGELDQVSFKIVNTGVDDDDDDDDTSDLNNDSNVIINEIDNSKYKTWLVIGICALIACNKNTKS